jgi:regulatory protein
VKGYYVGVVTALHQQVRNPERVNVFIDDEFRLGLTKALAARLRIGQELSEEDIQELLDQEAFEVAYRRAMRFISRRPHTTEEIRMKLSRKQAPTGVIQQVIERLHSIDLLDDTSFAQAWVENRQAFRPRGRRILRLELRKKGISDDIIGSVLENFDDEDAAYRAAQKAYPRYRSLAREVGEQRMLAYLARRGFNYRLCRKAVELAFEGALVSVQESEVET